MPETIEARIATVNVLGGRITLDDATTWRVAPDDRSLIRDWTVGQLLQRVPNEPDKLYSYRLLDPASGTAVSVVASQDSSP